MNIVKTNIFNKRMSEHKRREQLLFDSIIRRQAEIEEWLDNQLRWNYADGIYLFYYQSSKAYSLQEETKVIVSILNEIAYEIDVELHDRFKKIVSEGTGKKFEPEHNNNWLTHARPIVEAYLHVKYFAEMMIQQSAMMKVSTSEPQINSSGWAAILILFNLR